MAKFELSKLEKSLDVFRDVKGVLQLRDVMTKDVVTAKRDTTILEAAKLMEKHDISGLVIEDKGKPVGIVTERDMVRKVIIQGMERDARIEKIMTAPIVTLEMGEEITAGVKLMLEKGIRRLPVVSNGKLAGIVTATDIVGLF